MNEKLSETIAGRVRQFDAADPAVDHSKLRAYTVCDACGKVKQTANVDDPDIMEHFRLVVQRSGVAIGENLYFAGWDKCNRCGWMNLKYGYIFDFVREVIAFQLLSLRDELRKEIAVVSGNASVAFAGHPGAGSLPPFRLSVSNHDGTKVIVAVRMMESYKTGWIKVQDVEGGKIRVTHLADVHEDDRAAVKRHCGMSPVKLEWEDGGEVT